MKRIKEGFEKDVLDAVNNAGDYNQLIDNLKNIHIVFRGAPSGNMTEMMNMVDALEKMGSKYLPKTDDFLDARNFFKNQIDQARHIASSDTVSIIPGPGQLIGFQYKPLIEM